MVDANDIDEDQPDAHELQVLPDAHELQVLNGPGGAPDSEDTSPERERFPRSMDDPDDFEEGLVPLQCVVCICFVIGSLLTAAICYSISVLIGIFSGLGFTIVLTSAMVFWSMRLKNQRRARRARSIEERHQREAEEEVERQRLFLEAQAAEEVPLRVPGVPVRIPIVPRYAPAG